MQRVVTDFGADVPFGRIPQKLREHHGISVPVSSAQALTQTHAKQVYQSQELETQMPVESGVKQLIVEMDGTLIPIVQTSSEDAQGNRVDRRQTRQTSYKEARLALARTTTTSSPRFGATLEGVEAAGAQLLDCAINCGLGLNTRVHGVGDGAPWIAQQVEANFNEQATYLLDFYHLSQYLAQATQTCAPQTPQQWFRHQQLQLKRNRWPQVLEALCLHLEPAAVDEQKAPVRAAFRYMVNRLEQLDYQGAIEEDLPIGSGEIESAHRYVIQERLDLAGAWWILEKAEQMLALRVLRENREWDRYWDNQVLMAA